MGHAPTAVVFQTLSCVVVTVVRRNDFDCNESRICCASALRPRIAIYGEIDYAKESSHYADSKLG